VTRRGAEDDPFESVYVRLVASGVLDQVDAHAPVVSLVSRLRGEGVTTLCVELARKIAGSGKRVLLVDACPHGTRAAAMLGVSTEPLAADSASDPGKVQGAIATAPAHKVDVLVVAGAELAAAASAAAWNGVRQRYDAIVVDTGSLQSDLPHRWRSAIDKSLLVMDPQQTTYEILERFRADLDHSALRLSGFIMNRRAFPVPALVYRLAR
jgi:Mrp family chromosome partitioning ATPase